MGDYVPITRAELEKTLWGAATALRGFMDASDYKNYVFPALFWKWISDNYYYEKEQFEADYEGVDLDAETRDEIEADYHAFVIPPGASWDNVYLNKDVPDEVREKKSHPLNPRNYIGAKMRSAMTAIQNANPEKLSNIFGDAAYGNQERLKAEGLRNMLAKLAENTFNAETVPGDSFGDAYEFLLKKFSDDSGTGAGEFFTPRPVVRLITRLLDPQPEESIYDPACGSGGMLIEACNTVEEHGGDPRTLTLQGQEKNMTTQAIARMNLYIHNLPEHKIIHDNTLLDPGNRRPDNSFEQYDVVIANPPFSVEDWGWETWEDDPRIIGDLAPNSYADFAFMQHMITSMKPRTGRIGVVMPHGILYRGHAEKRIRTEILKRDLIEAVIGMPNNIFYGTTIPSCLVILRAEKAEARKNKILFVDASTRFVKGSNMNELTDEDVNAILSAFHDEEDVDGADEGIEFRLVDMDEIAGNDYDLNIGRYVQASTDVEVDLEASIAEWNEAELERERARDAFRNLLKEVDFGG